MNQFPTLNDIKEAAARIKPYVHRTPVMTCETLNRMSGCRLFLKCENFQKVGAFKARGAMNAVMSLSDEEAAKGVITHSSGNHGAALALAARSRGIKAYVVMPDNAPAAKLAAVKGYGAEVHQCEPTLDARAETASSIMKKTGAVMIHPFNDPRIVSGQGTAALELLEQVEGLDYVLAPVGGGGLLSGTAICATGTDPAVQVYGAEPFGADDAKRSLDKGEIVPMIGPKTIADGLLTSLGDVTFPIIQKLVKDIICVSEDEIVNAMRLVWERMKIIIEPSSAVPVAAVMKGALPAEGKKVGLIISGGNLDLGHLPWQE